MNSGRRTARQEEEFHVKRRNAELRKQEHWNSVSDYFKTWDVKASKYASWTSQKYYQQSQEARVEEEKKQMKQQTLTERKQKLKRILDEEQKGFEDEVKRMSRPGNVSWLPLEELKSVNLELKRRSEEARKRESELLLYQKWKQEQPTLKDLERRQHLEFMKKSWIDQVKEREAVREKQKAEEAIRAKKEELMHKEKEEMEKCYQKRREEEIKDLKQQIKLQVEEIKENVRMFEELERREAEERRFQSEIEEMMTQRKLGERREANKELVSYWSKQYQQKLQKKAKEVEEEIKQDQKILKSLEEQLNKESQAKALVREIAKKEMELALKELQTQRQRELLRQQEYEYMFFEEAKRTWEVQERMWVQERQARDRLMKEVLNTLKTQIEEKLQKNMAQKAEALEERERLLKSTNELYQQCSERDEEAKLAQHAYCKDLDNQVAEKTIEKARKAQEEAEEKKKLSEFEKETEQKLAVEINKLQLNTSQYRPHDFRRRRVVW